MSNFQQWDWQHFAKRSQLCGVIETLVGKNDNWIVSRIIRDGSSEYIVYYKEKFFVRRFAKKNVQQYLN